MKIPSHPKRFHCWLLLLLSAFAFARTGYGQEEPPGGTWRIGVLFWHDSPNDAAAFAGIREALDERAKPYELTVKEADENPEAARQILTAFQKDGLDCIFAMGTQAALCAAETVYEIPVVFTAVTHPVESKVVSTWKGSGRNLAGNSNWIDSKSKLHVFSLAVPGLKRLGVLRSEKQDVITAAEIADMRLYLGREGAPEVEIREEVVKGVDEIEDAVKRLAQGGAQAIWIPIDKLVYESMGKALDAVKPFAIPLVSTSLKGAKAGAVVSVVVDYKMLGKRSVLIARDILDRGVDPGTIPVGVMNGYHVIVNMKAARQCSYEPPLSLLVIADSILDEDVPFKEKEDGEALR